VFEKRVLRTFEPKRKETTEAWIKLNNEELHNLYSSPKTIRTIKLRETRSAHGKAYKRVENSRWNS
jgi:hypothetical protein